MLKSLTAGVLVFFSSLCFGNSIEIGRICVRANPEDASPPTLKAGALILLEFSAKGLTGCVSGSSYSNPKVTKIDEHSWKVTGGFTPTHAKVLTPDCGGGRGYELLGKLPAGTYEVAHETRTLKFTIPSPRTEICLD